MGSLRISIVNRTVTDKYTTLLLETKIKEQRPNLLS